MEQKQKWLKATEELYKKGRLDNLHGFFADIPVSPLGLETKRVEPESTFPVTSSFYNICEFQDDTISTEFLNSPQSGVFLYDHWPESLSKESSFVYLALSSQLTDFKKGLLKKSPEASLNYGVDPFSLGLWQSHIDKSHIESDWIEQTGSSEQRLFRLTSQPYSMAGASDALQLAVLLSSVVQLIDDYEGVCDAGTILNNLSFELTLKPHLFLSGAKIQALKLLVTKLSQAYNLEALERPPIYCAPAVRFLATREPWNNILRLTAIHAAARVGGADGVLTFPYDLFSKRQGGRTSRNVSEILEREAYLGKVSSSTQGSYTQEQLTDGMAARSWSLFQEIQTKNGLLPALRSGWLHDQIRESAIEQKNNFLAGRLQITGCNSFPLSQSLSSEYPLARQEESLDIETWWKNHCQNDGHEVLCDVKRLVPESLPAYFERWQFRADQWRSQSPKGGLVPVLVEPGMENSQKLQRTKRLLSLAALDVQITSIEALPKTTLAVVIASDPSGDFVKQSLDRLEKASCQWVVWTGEKAVEGFHAVLGQATDLQAFYEKMFNIIGRQL